MYVLVCNILIKGQNEFDVSFLSFQSSSNIKKGIQRRRQDLEPFTEDRETARPPKNHPKFGKHDVFQVQARVLDTEGRGSGQNNTTCTRDCLPVYTQLFTFSQSEVHLSLHMRVDSLEEEYNINQPSQIYFNNNEQQL